MTDKNKNATFRILSLRLLRTEKTPEDALKDCSLHKDLHTFEGQEDILEIFGCTAGKQPSWINLYSISQSEAENLQHSRFFGLFFIKFEVKATQEEISKDEINKDEASKFRWMVMTNGWGHQLLNSDAIEQGFGLYTTLNSINPDKLTRVDSRTIGHHPRFFRENAPLGSKQEEFNEWDLLQRMAGKVKGKHDKAEIESNIFGSDMLKIRFTKDICVKDLPELCIKYFKKYQEKTYQQYYSLNLEPVFNKQITEALEEKLAIAVNKCIQKPDDYESETIALDPFVTHPAIYEKVKFIKFGKPKKTCYFELNFNNYLNEISKNRTEKEIFESGNWKEIKKLLKKHHIQLCNEDGKRNYDKSRSVDESLIFDAKYRDSSYLYCRGFWRKVSSTYLNKIEKYFHEKCKASILSHYNEEELFKNSPNFFKRNEMKDKEAKYNEKAAKEKEYLCLDQKLVHLKEGNINKFEICDILSEDGFLYHVKIHGDTHTLGHLFNQGLICGTYLKKNKDARAKVIDMISEQPRGKKFAEVIQRQPEDLTICFAVIAKESVCKKALRSSALIPFYIVTKSLEKMGYKVEFQWIKDISPVKPKSSKVQSASSSIHPTQTNSCPLPMTTTSAPSLKRRNTSSNEAKPKKQTTLTSFFAKKDGG